MKKLLFLLLIFLFGMQASAQIPETMQPVFSFEGNWIVTVHDAFDGNAVDTIGEVFAILLCFPDSKEFAIMTGSNYETGLVETLWFPITNEEQGYGASMKCVSGDYAELDIDDEHGKMNVTVSYVSQKHPIVYRYDGVFNVEDDED